MTEPTIPPLPEPADVIIVGTQALRAFTADQMRGFYAQGYREGLEAAEKATNELRNLWVNNGSGRGALRHAIATIRAVPRKAEGKE